MIHTFLGMRSFVQTTRVTARLCTMIKTHSPISCTGAAVSCLKMAVEYWTCQSFANGGQCCAKTCSPYNVVVDIFFFNQAEKCGHLHLQH